MVSCGAELPVTWPLGHEWVVWHDCSQLSSVLHAFEYVGRGLLFTCPKGVSLDWVTRSRVVYRYYSGCVSGALYEDHGDMVRCDRAYQGVLLLKG